MQAATRTPLTRGALDRRSVAFYRRALRALARAGVPYLVGGAYAFASYSGIERHTKDLDLFVRPEDRERALSVLAGAGFATELSFPHWLGKAFEGEHCIDVIFGAGNGIARVDDAWFEHAPSSELLGVQVRLCPPEEMIWSKAFIMERERFDGADVAHLLRALATRLDWERLLARFGRHWRVLLSHLVLFGYIYPGDRHRLPAGVLDRLCARVLEEARRPETRRRVCQGTLLSREQYLTDVNEWEYGDPRLGSENPMTYDDVKHWTAAIYAER